MYKKEAINPFDQIASRARLDQLAGRIRHPGRMFATPALTLTAVCSSPTPTARHGVASRPLRRLGMAALLIRGAGDAELVGKQRYDRLCSNAASSSSSSSSFTPRRRRSLRERKMREVKGEEKQRKREKGGRDKNEGEGMEARRKREPVRVLRPRQLSLQVRRTCMLPLLTNH